MTEPHPQSESAPVPTRAADWEAFYRDYRKPGYVSGFEITTKLGGGMFGLVFRARKQSIGKDYAIKFLQVDDGEVRRAVLAELEQVQYFAQIDHPNLVSIEDRGEVDGIPFLVMSFAGTETLRDRMPTDGKVPTAGERDELVRYFLQCCRGLSALHERSLVHFDIKPANVFLKGAVARLGDYGLSKLVTHSRGSLSMGRGTPYYMAPEMLQRRGDHRSDIYSLGVMLYEILCGRVPFTGDSEWAVLKQHESRAPELPGHLSPLERTVLQRCLQKDPAARFQSVHDLIAAFGAQSSVGAAAWSDVRAGASAGAAPTAAAGPMTPPPLPAVPPLPLPEPGSKAEQLAEKALLGARKVVRATHEAVRDTMQELRRDGHGRPARHRRALARLRGRRLWPARAPRPPREAAPRSGTVGKTLLVIGVAAVSLLFLSVWLLAPVAMYPAPLATESWAPTVEHSIVSVEVPPPPPPAQDRSRSATFSGFGVPRRYTDLVSTSEPTWVAMARRDRERAAEVLDNSLDELRRRVPFLPEDRVRAGDLPTFGPLRTLPAAEQQVMERVVGRVLADGTADDADDTDAIAAELVQLGPVAMATLAQRLGAIPYADQADVARAHRAHAVLQRATGCYEMTLVVEGALGEIARANRPVGTLWCWFLNEVAHTDLAWRTYRDLRGGR